MIPKHPSDCQPDRLLAVLNGRLSLDDEVTMVAHLEDCRACQIALQDLAAEQGEWDTVRQSFAQGVTEADHLGPLEQPLESLLVEDNSVSKFLEPLTDPSKLGRLGEIEILSVIGTGGMGIVLKGYDPALKRYVAVKVLAPAHAINEKARARFRREAESVAAVVSEYVVPIHSVCADHTPPYLVMSFVPGGSLQERIDQLGVLSLPEILRIGHQIATGLQSAHAKSIVHRDVKPANVLIEDGLDKIKLTDFGLARSIDDVKLTHLGIVAGTPQYMSPEQTRGDKVDFRSDLFSLGITLYTMSTGTLPFRAEESLSVMNQICETRPAPMQELNPDIPAWLDTLVSKAMRKSPDDRFQSAAEMAELLKLCLAHIEQPSLVPIPACLSSSSTHTLGSITSSVGIRWIAASLFAISLAALSIWAVFFNEPVHPLAQTTSPDTAFDLVAPHDPEVIWLPGQVLPGKNQIFSFEQGVLRGHIFTRTTEDGHLVLAVNGIGFDSKIPFRDTHLRLVDESGRVVPMQGLRAAIPSNSKLLRISYTQRSILPFKSPALICLKVEPPDEKEKDVD